jgi:hypothetical protein
MKGRVRVAERVAKRVRSKGSRREIISEPGNSYHI